MAKTPKQFLILSLVFLVIGFADTHAAILWGVAKPLGAIFFILFLLTHLMSDEMAKYEEECRLKLKASGKSSPSKKTA